MIEETALLRSIHLMFEVFHYVRSSERIGRPPVLSLALLQQFRSLAYEHLIAEEEKTGNRTTRWTYCSGENRGDIGLAEVASKIGQEGTDSRLAMSIQIQICRHLNNRLSAENTEEAGRHEAMSFPVQLAVNASRFSIRKSSTAGGRASLF
ncbi:hypothetical protein CEXT_68941 [Caerostris extrusa]|uniref:Uncharacterized protein n=1 Tax=Caerostris extrusa TaxID=172846 RepID=A0AAV4TE73_CAEEX|nr:hypothetical protein CEXT_68941 [Caerostris extrusa]